MAKKGKRKSSAASGKRPRKLRELSDQELDEAQRNLEHALESYDQRGEEGLEESLDRIYPPTGLRRVPFMGGDSYALAVSPEQARRNKELALKGKL